MTRVGFGKKVLMAAAIAALGATRGQLAAVSLASTAMLAQANALPQSVLRLLQ